MWMQTFTGLIAEPMEIKREQIVIADIARSLAMTCRFNGHVKEFYSVAQHSIEVSRHLPKQLALAGLLHDAAEAYLGDVVAPLKQGTEFYGRKAEDIEEELLGEIFNRFDVPWPNVKQWELIGIVDVRMLMTEKRDLLNPEPQDWQIKADPYGATIYAWSHQLAEQEFMSAFNFMTEAGVQQ